MSAATFKPLPMPDFITDRERMLYSQVIALVEPFLASRGYAMRWNAEQYFDPECGDEEHSIYVEVIGYPKPESRDDYIAWYDFQSEFHEAYAPVVEAYRGTSLDDDIFDVVVRAALDGGQL